MSLARSWGVSAAIMPFRRSQPDNDQENDDGQRKKYRLVGRHFTTFDAYKAALQRAKASSKCKYWEKLHIVEVAGNDERDLKLKCNECGDLLTAKNPADAASTHFAQSSDGSCKCKKATKKQQTLSASLDKAGEFNYSLIEN
jgi:hypothetical protein